MPIWRRLLKVFGWLLTPVLAWAASFCGARAATILAARIADPMTGVYLTMAAGAVAAFAVIILWLFLVRRSPRVRETLALTPEGAPDTAAIEAAVAEHAPDERRPEAP
ncbi:MAG: hypothetical protein ACOY71_11510 [Gemmatimonadota bacterium]